MPTGDLAALAGAFPFHLLIAPDLRLHAIGSGLARMDPALRPGVRLDAHFDLAAPAGPLDWPILTGAADTPVRLVHRRTQLVLEGRMARTDPAGPALFLGTCWLDDAEQLADFGVSPDQLASGPVTTAMAGTDHDIPQDRDRLIQCLRLHQAVSRALADSPSAEAALDRLVEALPVALGWPAATRWHSPVDGPLVAAQPGPTDPAEASFAARAWAAGAPLWTEDDGSGRGGFALTAHGEQGVLAVITCRSPHPEPRDALAREVFAVAGQLARFLLRQAQRRQLSRLTGELSAIFQLCPDGIVAFNADRRLSYLNPAFARMTGMDRDALRGLDPDAFEARLATLADTTQPTGQTGTGDPVVRLVRPRTCLLQRSQHDARELDGRLIGQLLYFRDITLEDQLLRANGEFLANAAHELRTPMASIHGFVDLLRRHPLPAAQQTQVLDTIHRQTTRLSAIIDELLDVARFDARGARDLDLQIQPLTPLLRTVAADLLVPDDPRRPQLDLPDEATSPVARIDRDRIVQALTNVLSNAYKYSPDGGDIQLRLLTRRRNEADWVAIAVRDHGIGMRADEQAHLGERFYRAHPGGAIPGTGLGLAMVRKIVEAHGGLVEIDSAPGDGTEVRLWLPQAPPAQAPTP